MRGVRRVFYIFGIVFAGIMIGIFGSNYFAHFEYKKILQNGTKVEAYADSCYSSLSINGKKYYYLNVHFEADGQTRKGKTSTRYTVTEIRNMHEGDKIDIYYDSNYNVVEADYKPGPMFKTSSIVFYIASTVCGVLVLCLIINIFKSIRLNIIKKTGTPAIAKVLRYSTNVSVNGVPKYFISYSFKNNNNETVFGKSDSKYSLREAQYFDKNKVVDIRYSGKKSVISERPFSKPGRTDYVDNFDGDHQNLPSNKNQEGHISIDTENDYNKEVDFTKYGHATIYENEEILCEHCGSYIPKNKRKCPNCGAKTRN